jgi:Winged helix DNA-binding domain
VTADRLRRLRLTAQRLSSPAGDVREAARAVIGVQAQDLRAAGFALRSRVPGLERAALGGLVRTWTVRGTLHLVDPDDRPWLHALTGPANLRRFERALAARGGLDIARARLNDLVAALAEGPRTRAELLPPLPPRAANVLLPWVAAQGRVVGLADGRWQAADPPPPVDADEALATAARRYLAGYGPARPADLAAWSGLALGGARRALEAAGQLERDGELLALRGALDAAPPPAPPALLLAAFDTLMLGYRSRAPVVAPADDRRVLPGGGMLRPVALARGRATGTWRVARGTVAVEWFGRPAPARALAAEVADVERFLSSPG